MVNATRTSFLCGLTATGAFAGTLTAVRPARAADLIKLRVGVIPIMDTAPFFAAQQFGYFTASGLDIETSSETTGAVGIPALVAGGYQIVYSNVPSVLTAIQQGIDLRFITQGDVSIGPPDTTAVVVRKGERIASGKDLQGKTFAVNANKSLQWIFARSWVKATGGNPDLVTYREVPFPSMGDALKTKAVDAIFAIDPFLAAIMTDPTVEIAGYPFSTVMKNSRPACWIVTGDFAKNHADQVRAFLTAFNKGVDWVKANGGKPPFIKLAAGFTHIDEARLAGMRLPTPQVGVDIAQIRRMAGLMRENGLPVSTDDIEAHVFR